MLAILIVAAVAMSSPDRLRQGYGEAAEALRAKAEGLAYGNNSPEGLAYADSSPEGVAYADSSPEGLAYGDSSPEGLAYGDSSPKRLAYVQAPQAQAPDIRNFLQVTPEFCTAGQPRIEHFAALKSRGVKAVLNLRQPSEHRAEEEKTAVEAAGMKYFNIPVVYAKPTDEQVDEFLRITDDRANRPILVHCTAAIRVGGFWLIRRVMRDGMSWDAALDEARKVGLNNAPHLEEFAKAYIASHKK